MRDMVAPRAGTNQQCVCTNHAAHHLPGSVATLVAVGDGVPRASAEDSGYASGRPRFQSTTG